MNCPDIALQPSQHCQAPWVAHNRQIALLGLGLNQDYRETDTSGKTANGVFNAERGSVEGQGVRGRWQGEVALGTLALPLWIVAMALLVGVFEACGGGAVGNTASDTAGGTSSGTPSRSGTPPAGTDASLAIFHVKNADQVFTTAKPKKLMPRSMDTFNRNCPKNGANHI